MDVWLNHYQTYITWKTPFPGQHGEDKFGLDYRSTHDPLITDKHIQFYLKGESLYKGQGCDDLSPGWIDFDHTHTMSQLVVTEAAATCAAQQIAKSPLSRFHLNRKSMNEFFGANDLRFDTSSMKRDMPILHKKLGENKPLTFILSFRDMKVGFAQGDKDVTLEMVARISIYYDHADPLAAKKNLPKHELFYDEFPVVASGKVECINDVFKSEIDQLQLNIDKKYGQRDQPKRNNMDLTTNEYKEMLGQLQFTFNFWRKYLNDVLLRDGTRFPYNMKEFDTTVKFKNHAMYFLFEVEPTAFKELPKEEWYEDLEKK